MWHQALTTRVITLWYRPPELLLGAVQYDCTVDIWSAGCIFAEMLRGAPVLPGRTEVEQLHQIFKLCGSEVRACCSCSELYSILITGTGPIIRNSENKRL